MIKAITVTNYLGESLKMELMFPEKSGFVIQKIEGLGPPKATINSTEVSTGDGSIYNSARVSSRNIVISLQFLDEPSVEQNRQKSYKYFPIKKEVSLLIETDGRTCRTSGHVESNEPDIFSNDETTQISIICPDPYLYSAGEAGVTTTIFSGVEAMFEFPFANESLTDNLLDFCEIVNRTEETVYYTGDSEVGMIITVHSLGSVTGLEIYNTGTREVMRVNDTRLIALTGSGIVLGDEIKISTIKGSKSITLLRNGVYTNILNCLDKNSDWFQLAKGDNIFAYTATTGITNLQFLIENQTIYEGV